MKVRELPPKFVARGYVYGQTYMQDKGFYPAIPLQGRSLEEIKEKIKKGLKNKSLDSGFGFQALLGAIYQIEQINRVEIDGKIYQNSDFLFIIEGELPEECKLFSVEEAYKRIMWSF